MPCEWKIWIRRKRSFLLDNSISVFHCWMQLAKWCKRFTNSNFRSKIVLIRFLDAISLHHESMNQIKQFARELTPDISRSTYFGRMHGPYWQFPNQLVQVRFYRSAGTPERVSIRENYLCIRCFALVCIALGHASFGALCAYFLCKRFVRTWHDGQKHINLTQKHFNFGLHATGNGMARTEKQTFTDSVESPPPPHWKLFWILQNGNW